LECARTAFVGRTLRGPVNQPVFIGSFAEFQRIFGGLWQPSPLGYAVEQFFDNGGREALVVRVANAARAASLKLPAGDETLTLRALRPGTREFLRAGVDYDNIAGGADSEFNLIVQRVRSHGTAQVEDQEIYLRVSVVPTAERYLVDLLAASDLVSIDGPIPGQRPDQTLDPGSGLPIGYVSSNTDGDDGAPLTDYDLIGSEVDHTGLFALDGCDYFNLLCIPPVTRDQDVGPCVLLVAARYCKHRRALLMVDPPADWHTADDVLRGMRNWSFASEDALMYFPRVLAHDKLRGQFESFAPCGAAAGMLARADETHPVWGPAKTDGAILRPGYRPVCLVTEDKRERLASLGINTLQAVRSSERLGMAPRTLGVGTAAAADWQLLAPRRLALFILNSIERGTRWTLFNDSSAHVARLVETQLREFFEELHGDGAFGMRPLEESFFISVPSASQMVIGFAAGRTGELHGFRIAHSITGSTVTPVSLNRLANRSAPHTGG
jgi:hypothetical protein